MSGILRSLAWVLPAAVLLRAAAGAAPLPILAGEISGEVQVLDGRLAIPWRATVHPDAWGGPRFSVVASPPDAELRVSLALDRSGEHGMWRVDAGQADAAAWTPRLAPILAPGLPELAVTGQLALHGQGSWRDGRAHGPLTLAWRAPTVSASRPALALTDLALDFTFASGWASQVWQGDGALQVAEATVGGVPLRNLAVAYSLHPDGTIRVTAMSVEAFGGLIDVAPFSWKSGAAEVRFALEFSDVDLVELATWLPDLVRNARGKVHGRASFRWREDLGVQPLGGELNEVQESQVELTLAPQPGLLTGNLPRRLPLPGWLGPLGRWLAPDNPVIPTLEQIELGRAPLSVEEFALEFFPPDDPLGRTARVRIVGRPLEDPLLEKVVLTVNLSGPLTDLLKLGAGNQIRIESAGAGSGARDEVP